MSKNATLKVFWDTALFSFIHQALQPRPSVCTSVLCSTPLLKKQVSEASQPDFPCFIWWFFHLHHFRPCIPTYLLSVLPHHCGCFFLRIFNVVDGARTRHSITVHIGGRLDMNSVSYFCTICVNVTFMICVPKKRPGPHRCPQP